MLISFGDILPTLELNMVNLFLSFSYKHDKGSTSCILKLARSLNIIQMCIVIINQYVD